MNRTTMTVVRRMHLKRNRYHKDKEFAIMAKSRQSTQGAPAASKQPFVSQKDRPEMRINLDTPLGELRVRELSAILGFMTGKNPNFEVGKTSLKDFFDKDFPEVAKDWVKELKSEKLEKNEIKDSKGEKTEKLEKHEKNEKGEIKEAKVEKAESDGVFDPGNVIRRDPRMDEIIQAVAGLTKQVSQLSNQVAELQKKG